MARSTTVGERVRAARVALGLTGRALERAADMTPGHVWLIENRPNASISSNTARALATALGVSIDWLIAGVGAGPKSPRKKTGTDG